MIKRILLGLMATFLITVGISILMAGYFFSHPEKFFQIVNSVTHRVFQSKKYEEKEEFFIQGVKDINFVASGMTLNIETYSGKTLKVHVQGKISPFDQGPFVLQTLENNVLQLDFRDVMASSWIHLNINGEEMTQNMDAQLEAKIYFPESFKGQLNVQTVRGKVALKLPSNTLYELDLQSSAGKISNMLKQKSPSTVSAQDIGHIKVLTGTGDIAVDPR
ncbi:MAG: hypothetical protein ACXVCY_16420 [Pseudobdellovibrionaceae bacterium]